MGELIYSCVLLILFVNQLCEMLKNYSCLILDVKVRVTTRLSVCCVSLYLLSTIVGFE